MKTYTIGVTVMGGLTTTYRILGRKSDLLWWRNTKRIRFSFLPEKSHYQDSGKHIGSFLRGIPLFAVVAIVSAEIITMIRCLIEILLNYTNDRHMRNDQDYARF